MDQPTTYTSWLSTTASLLEETKRVLNLINQGASIEDAREQVVVENLLGKHTRKRRENVWQSIHRRYISGRSEEFIRLLAYVVVSPLIEQAKRQILFYELAMSDRLVYDLTVGCLYKLYHEGRSLATKADIHNWFDSAADLHPELKKWSEHTRENIAQTYLALVKDFGMLSGRVTKSFVKPFVPAPSFLWILYRLRDDGLTTKGIIRAKDFHLLLMDQSDVIHIANECARSGYLNFQAAGDIYDLEFIYEDLSEAINGLAAEIQ